jgi:hypothetical protein
MLLDLETVGVVAVVLALLLALALRWLVRVGRGGA